MTDGAKRWLIEQVRSHDSKRHGRRPNMINDNMDERGQGDYYDELDSRRGVKGSGRRMSNRRDRNDGPDMYDMETEFDGHNKELRLTKSESNRWLHEMENTDGTEGPHYSMRDAMMAAEKLGIHFNDFTEREFFVALNMWYSDFGHVTKRLVGDNEEKELLANADYAKAYLDDPDGEEPSVKLAVQYHCMRRE